MANSDTTYYAVVTTSGSAWEVGIGTYVSATNTLTRTTILSSSSGGTIVSFGTGEKYLFITQPSERAVYSVGSDVVSNNGATVPNSLLANSSITINGTTVSLGGSGTITAAAPNALTIGTGLSGTSYNGSAAVTIAIDSTVATLTGVQTLTNKTLTSPVMTTPALGTPASGVMTNVTGLPLTTGVTGTLPTGNGGTGLSSYTAGDTTYYASGTALTKLAIGAAGTIKTSTGTAPQWVANLTTAQGGTGLASYTAGDLPYYASGTAFTKLGIGTNGQVLTSNGTAPTWSAASAIAVSTISFGTTGLTPATATAGAVTVAGTLALANGGTGATTVAAAQTNLQVDPAGTAVAMAIALG
jgi:hypothetical protein